MRSISIDQLANEITKAVTEYTEDVERAIEREVDQTADIVLKETQQDAPKKTGDYAKGFKKTNRDSPGVTRRIIWNKKHSGLVHLLEFGHAKVGGGRVAGRPHLRVAYDRNASDLLDRIRKIIRNGG